MLDVGVILDNGLWSHFPDRKLSVRLSEIYKTSLALNDIPLNETVSDRCVSQMLHKCLISNQCLAVMTAVGYQDYPLSHQVFFWEMVKMVKKLNIIIKVGQTFLQR